MRKRLSEVVAYLDSTRQALMATTAGAGASFASLRARDGTWSVAENLAHLAMVEDGIARLVERSVEWGRSNGVPAEESDSSVMSSIDAFELGDPGRKRTAPEIVMPPRDAVMADALQSLTRSRVRLREALVSADGMDLTRLTRAHPLLGELNMYQWAIFVAQHEERHRRQIERTMKELTERVAQCAPIP